jgi:hypothetical protein
MQCRSFLTDLEVLDNIDHGKLLLALEKHVSENWCLLYIKRWLNAAVLTKSGKLFLGYDCAISINSKKRIADKMEVLDIVGLTY